jgi:hypothetical protein
MNVQKAEHDKMEKAKVLKSVRDSGIPYDDYLKVKNILLSKSDNESAIEKSIKGLSEEDEFAMICRLMKTATNLVYLEQSPTIPSSNYITPDFLARFQPSCSAYGFTRSDSSGFKSFIEVKSTTSNSFSIKGARLNKRRNFTDEFGLPLLFAVRFLRFAQNALWIVVEDSNREATSLTVTIDNLVSGVRHIIWDEYWYMLRPKIYFKGIFDLGYTKNGVQHPQYGIQREFQVIVDGKTISFEESNAVVYSAFFEAFNLKEIESQRSGSITNQILSPQLLLCSMVDMVYNFNRLPTDSQQQSIYNASKMVKQPDVEGYDIDFIDKIAQSLAFQDLLFYTSFGEKETHLKKWQQYGGKQRVFEQSAG